MIAGRVLRRFLRDIKKGNQTLMSSGSGSGSGSGSDSGSGSGSGSGKDG